MLEYLNKDRSLIQRAVINNDLRLVSDKLLGVRVNEELEL